MSALGERSVHIREVEGSNPFRSTKQGIGRTPISSAAVSPCSVRSDPQQKNAVLEVIPRRRFFAIRTFDFRYFSCYNDCRNKQEVIQIHLFPYTVCPCATGANFLVGVKFPYISIKGELQKLRLIPHKFPLFFGILPKKRNKNLQTGIQEMLVNLFLYVIIRP